MGKTTSRKIIFNRKRFNVRKYLKLRNFVVLFAIIGAVILLSSIITTEVLKKKVSKSTIVYNAKDVEKENINNNENETELTDKEKINKNNESLNNTDNIDLMVLGEIMMGGKITSNLNYDYIMAFKDIYNITKNANFTYANLATNITNLDEIKDAKSDYLVTKNILSAFNALGIDALSIANDHITDFPSDIIKNTTELLENNNIFVAGRSDMPVYFEKNGKKIAIVSSNSVIIGTSNNYTKNGISIYDEENIKKNISEAKKMADFVIVDLHWGKGESSFGVSDQMTQMARFVIDNGADLVMGTHAIGIQPIEIYNNKPIIYTTGYLITDLEYETTKSNYMFDLIFDKDMKLNEIHMIPTYIKDLKEVSLYTNYDEVSANINMKSINSRNIQNGLNSNMENGKIIVKF